jgi:peptidoglycan/xylan/chitin deacetylase (PgdA/CDA1 family)
MLFRNPQALAFVLIALGTGLLAWYGPKWYELPEWSEAEIEQSVDLNLAIDLQRMGPHLQPTGERLERLRDMVRAEVQADIRREREVLERWLGGGLILTVLGLGQLVHTLGKRRA